MWYPLLYFTTCACHFMSHPSWYDILGNKIRVVCFGGILTTLPGSSEISQNPDHFSNPRTLSGTVEPPPPPKPHPWLVTSKYGCLNLPMSSTCIVAEPLTLVFILEEDPPPISHTTTLSWKIVLWSVINS